MTVKGMSRIINEEVCTAFFINKKKLQFLQIHLHCLNLLFKIQITLEPKATMNIGCGFMILVVFTTLRMSQQTNPGTTRNIYISPDEARVDQIKGTSTPWVKAEFVPIIEKFKNEVMAAANECPRIRKVYGTSSNSSTIRIDFFKNTNSFLTFLGHPAPAPLANIVSKAASLFETYTLELLMETIAINLAEFLLSHNIEVTRNSSQIYVDSFSKYLEKANGSDPNSVYMASYRAYADFPMAYGYKLMDIIDEFLAVFVSITIILHDK